eukprot:jgi/Psemu1/301837/fgenesh1_kg.48_\
MAMATAMASEEEKEKERIECLVQQGFTPSLARNVLLARSRESLPLTIWICDNSTSMNASDGRRLVSTKSQDDVRVESCTRWEELRETITYHGQLAALLEAPTKFVFLNRPVDENRNEYPGEMSIAERGSEWIEDDMEYFVDNVSRIVPLGVTPLTYHLRRVYQSLQYMETKIVLVLATDGRPTDGSGFVSPSVDREFEAALRQVQSKAWIVVRLCTNDDSILQYYQRLDEHMELSLEVLDDYTDEAKEVQAHNPWLTYSLGLHRCREMGMSCHGVFRFLDWLDERPLTRDEIGAVLRGTFGLIGDGGDIGSSSSYESYESFESDNDWNAFCDAVKRDQERLVARSIGEKGFELRAFFPWNPIRKRTTHWIDIWRLKRHGCKSRVGLYSLVWIILVAAIAIYLKSLS